MKKRIFLVMTLFFLVGAAGSIPSGFQVKWGIESVYAQATPDRRITPPPPPPGHHDPLPIPNPPTLTLIGMGLAVVGGYWGIRKFWK